MLADGQDFAPIVEKIGFPCVVKPTNRGGGKGVTAGITSLPELERAIAHARTFSSQVLLEAHQEGTDYRLMVVDGRLVAAVRRDPPAVEGNGKASVRALIAELNRARKGPLREVGFLNPVHEDAALQATLARQGLTLDSVLALGQRVVLRTNANRSTGGVSVSVLDQVHPQVKAQAELVAQAFDLRAAGIDYITPDISRSQEEVGGVFIEVNATPGMTVISAAGMPEEEIGGLILGDQPGVIPVQLIVCSAEELPALDAAVRRDAAQPGCAAVTSQWAEIGGTPLAVETLRAAAKVEAVLRFRSVERLTILWTLDELCQLGVPAAPLESVVIHGPAPGEEWMEVLRTVSARVIQADSDPQPASDSATPLPEAGKGRRR
jgi:D-alanine-D-alanine ligase-like ATP-grasp enzyme